MKDINTNPSPVSSTPQDVTAVGNLVYFTADDGPHGRELWRTDGTTAGTILLADIYPGQESSFPGSDSGGFAEIGGVLYFAAGSNTTGCSLWRSDGTQAGTVLVKSFSPDPCWQQDGYHGPLGLMSASGTLYFSADDGVHGRELWKSDGTEAGTALVKDIQPGAAGSSPGWFFDLDGTLVFFADGAHGRELWRSDGTEAGTVLLKEIDPGPGGSFGIVLGSVYQGALLFFADDGVHGGELWKTDGTEAGTALVKDIKPGRAGSVSLSLMAMLARQEALFFFADDGAHGTELWRSDGTEEGTVLVKDINPGPGSGVWNPSDIESESLVDINGTFFFHANDGTGGLQLWKSDGSEPGTVLVKAIPGGYGPNRLTAVGDMLFFVASDGSSGFELWKSDGTAAGTALVKDINPGPADSDPVGLTNVNGRLVFKARDGASGDVPPKLWTSDGTEAGTVIVKVFQSIDLDNSVTRQRVLTSNGTLVFVANDGKTGAELWTTDATEAGTVLIKDINSPPGSSYLDELTDVNGTLFFGADDGNGGRGLWKSDGTAAGTVLLKRFIRSFPNFSLRSLYGLTNIEGTLFFFGDEDGTGAGLWKTDGTSEGTVLVRAFVPTFSPYGRLVNVAGTAFFVAGDGQHGPFGALWKTDGTAAGTQMVNAVLPFALTNFNGRLFFVTMFHQLWTSDGTAAGTVVVANVPPLTVDFFGASTPPLPVAGDNIFFATKPDARHLDLWKSDGTGPGTIMVLANVFPTNLTNLNGILMFAGSTPSTGTELWRSDGTAAGTVMVKDINPGPDGTIVNGLTSVNGALFFVAADQTNGFGLWKSDGTDAGTVMLKGSGVVRPLGLTEAAGMLLFFQQGALPGTAQPQTESHVFELWRSDGTTSGTVRVQRGIQDHSQTAPPALAVSGTHVFFAADDERTGNELWAVPLDALSAACTGDCDGNWSVTVDELVIGVNITLGLAQPGSCTAFDVDHDGAVTVDELVAAVNRGLNGCS